MKTVRRTPTVYQMEAAECGAASLSMICAHFGRRIPLEQMRVETGVSRDGCSAVNIMRAARRLGLECHGYRIETQELRRLELPCIIHWNFNHFLVLEGFRGDQVFLNDPASGRCRTNTDELDACFTGVALTFRPTEAFPRDPAGRFPLPAALKDRLRSVRASLPLSVLPGLAGLCALVLLPFLLGRAPDAALSPGAVPFLLPACVLLPPLLSLLSSHLTGRLSDRLHLVSARSFVSRFLRLPASFYTQRHTGDLVGRAQANDSLSRYISHELPSALLSLGALVLSALCMLRISPALSAVAAAGLAASLLASFAAAQRAAAGSARLDQDRSRLAGALIASLGAAQAIRAAGSGQKIAERLCGYEAGILAQESRVGQAEADLLWLPSALSRASQAVALAVGCARICTGALSAGSLCAFILLHFLFCRAGSSLGALLPGFSGLLADSQRTDDILRCPQPTSAPELSSLLPASSRLQGEIECRDVSFGYSPLDEPLLCGLDLRLLPGEFLALAGPSGCGKSTVGRLLCALYAPRSGSILFDGVPVGRIPASVLHASVSYVGQASSLFSGTVRENLSLWDPSVTDADLLRAAEDACVADVILSRAGGFDLRLHEGAPEFSGGEKQRLEIARALARDPSVLILDEATSALDPPTELRIISNIRRRGCTCILITHRLSAVRNCDRIAVLHNGRIAEIGTHDRLMQDGSLYRALMQAE